MALLDFSNERLGTFSSSLTLKEKFDASKPNKGADAETAVISVAGLLRSGFSSEIWMNMFFRKPCNLS